MTNVKQLIGKRIDSIYMNESTLTFYTSDGPFSYDVEGDCCSHSYFYDFFGVKHLLGNVIVDAEEVGLNPGDLGYRPETWESGVVDSLDYEVIQVYGYRFTTHHPVFGPVSSVMSFRNSSNGYYGGSMDTTHNHLSAPRYQILEDTTLED